MKYYILRRKGRETIRIQENAKEDFKKMAEWSEKQFKENTLECYTREKTFNKHNKGLRRTKQ